MGYDSGDRTHQRGLSDLALLLKTKNKKTGQTGITTLFAGVFAFQLRTVLKLQSALNLVAAQAASAHGHALRSTIDDNANLLRVRSPGAARLAVGVADVVAGGLTFSTNTAYS